MAEETRIYISVESGDKRLVVDGSMSLWIELLDGMGLRVDAETVAPERDG